MPVSASYVGVPHTPAPAEPSAASASLIVNFCESSAPVSGSSAATEPRPVQQGYAGSAAAKASSVVIGTIALFGTSSG